MKRGEVWTAAGGPDYAGKPRPVVIVQADLLDATNSVTICAFTTYLADAPLFRVEVAATAQNGLRANSWLMADKLKTMPRSKLGHAVGVLTDDDLIRLNRAIVVFLGLAGARTA